MMADSTREESLREACAIGNLEKVEAFLRSGVNPNSKNKMNGWTALHWAVHRNNLKAAEILLKFGAESDIPNNQGYSPVFYASSPEMKGLFFKDSDVVVSENEQQLKPQIEFTPNYLLFPELIPAVSKPMESELQSSTIEINSIAKATTSSAASSKIQVLVSRDVFDESNLVGSVVADVDATIDSLIGMIFEQLDMEYLPSTLKWYHFSSGLMVPISSKQHSLKLNSLLDVSHGSVALVFKRVM